MRMDFSANLQPMTASRTQLLLLINFVMIVCFTGTRNKLSQKQHKLVNRVLAEYANFDTWVVGDCQGGVDNLVETCHCQGIGMDDGKTIVVTASLEKHRVTGTENYEFAKRSLRMIKSLPTGATVVGFPNKPCPPNCYPCKNPNGGGSGTYLTLAAAVYRGDLNVVVHPLADFQIPNWLQTKQLNLF